MTREKIILTDCDGVLLDWNAGFERHMDLSGFPRIVGTDAEYSLSARHGISMHRAHESVKEFNKSRYIAELEPFADSVENVIKLANLGFRFVVITSLSDHKDAHSYRTENLKNTFGDVFNEIICLETGSSKSYELSKWAGTEYFWIEDHMRQAEAGYEEGLKAILIDHPYNAHYSTNLFPRVSNKTPWAEIVEIIKKDYRIA